MDHALLVRILKSLILAKNGVHHMKTAPYHPAFNGQVERAVQNWVQEDETRYHL